MRILGKITTVFLILSFLLTAPSMADIRSVKIQSDNRDTILFSTFKFSHTGYVSVAVSSVAISNMPVTSNLLQPDPSRIGFFLLWHILLDRYQLELKRNPDFCALDMKFISVLFTFQDLSPSPPSSFNKSYNVTYPGVYSLYFANCNDLSLVTMDVHTEVYNTDGGITKNYLSAGLTPLPWVYFILSLIYLYFSFFWISLCLKNRRLIHRTHLLMGLLLVITFFHYICSAANQHHIKVAGDSHGWKFLFYTIQLIRAELFFTVFLLLGSGWCFWKRFLLGREILILMIFFILQVLGNVCSIVVEESGPYNENWEKCKDGSMLMDIICCVGLQLPIVLAANEDPKTTARNLKRRGLLFVGVIVYTFFTKVMLLAVSSIPWLLTAAQETSTLVFSFVMFHTFRTF